MKEKLESAAADTNETKLKIKSKTFTAKDAKSAKEELVQGKRNRRIMS